MHLKIHVDYAVDLWMSGILLVELLTGKRCFPSQDDIMLGNHPPIDSLSAPEPVKRLIKSLLQQYYPKRLGYWDMRDIFNHEAFKGFDWRALETGNMQAPWLRAEEAVEKERKPTEEEEVKEAKRDNASAASDTDSTEAEAGRESSNILIGDEDSVDEKVGGNMRERSLSSLHTQSLQPHHALERKKCVTSRFSSPRDVDSTESDAAFTSSGILMGDEEKLPEMVQADSLRPAAPKFNSPHDFDSTESETSSRISAHNEEKLAKGTVAHLGLTLEPEEEKAPTDASSPSRTHTSALESHESRDMNSRPLNDTYNNESKESARAASSTSGCTSARDGVKLIGGRCTMPIRTTASALEDVTYSERHESTPAQDDSDLLAGHELKHEQEDDSKHDQETEENNDLEVLEGDPANTRERIRVRVLRELFERRSRQGTMQESRREASQERGVAAGSTRVSRLRAVFER